MFGEFLSFDGAIRDVVRNGGDRTRLEHAARERGMAPLAETGRRLVERGVTTEAELERVLG